MIAIILVAAGLVFALLYVAKRTGVKGANEKPNNNTEPRELRSSTRKSFEEELRKATAQIKPPKKPNTEPHELQRERSMERSSARRIERERDRDNDSNYLKKDGRAKSSLTQEEFLAFQRLLHPDLHEHLREQEAKLKKRSFEEELREATAGIKVPARDLSRDRDRDMGMER